MEAVLKIDYDDQPDHVMEKVKRALLNFGITVEYGDGDDGWQNFVLKEQHDSHKS